MERIATKIHGAWLLRPRLFSDDRGFFMEAWNRATYAKLGLDLDFVQDNHSRSKKHVLRGLHYQIGEDAQTKLVWVAAGAVFDVLVDLRQSSPTFGQWDGYVLTADNHERLWVPAGCAHGFMVLSDSADFLYKCSTPYAPAAERTLRWDDTRLTIQWPLPDGVSPFISAKDAEGAWFDDCEKYDEHVLA
jgi:dTDP-4-dehydrorhamnose 3,5-epimerase